MLLTTSFFTAGTFFGTAFLYSTSYSGSSSSSSSSWIIIFLTFVCGTLTIMGFSSTTFAFLTGSTFFGSSFGSSFPCFGVFVNCFGGGICGSSSSSSLIIGTSSFSLKISASFISVYFWKLNAFINFIYWKL